jgi:hypothetical protein
VLGVDEDGGVVDDGGVEDDDGCELLLGGGGVVVELGDGVVVCWLLEVGGCVVVLDGVCVCACC